MDLSRNQLTDITIILCINTVPLLGVLTAGWDAYAVVMFYWFETAIFGFWGIVRVLMGDATDPDGLVRNVLVNLPKALFLIVHASIFMIVHLVFITVFFTDGSLFDVNPIRTFRTLVMDGGMWLPLLAVFVLRGGSEWLELRWGENQAETAMLRFYTRIIVMQISIIATGWVITATGANGLLFVLIAVKTAVDVMTGPLGMDMRALGLGSSKSTVRPRE